jgi:hypothetical protein
MPVCTFGFYSVNETPALLLNIDQKVPLELSHLIYRPEIDAQNNKTYLTWPDR